MGVIVTLRDNYNMFKSYHYDCDMSDIGLLDAPNSSGNPPKIILNRNDIISMVDDQVKEIKDDRNK